MQTNRPIYLHALLSVTSQEYILTDYRSKARDISIGHVDLHMGIKDNERADSVVSKATIDGTAMDPANILNTIGNTGQTKY